MFYTLLALLLFGFAVIQYTKKEYKTKSFEVIILFFGFWLVAGLAYETGVDWVDYSDAFGKAIPVTHCIANNGFFSSIVPFEPGFGFISSVTKTFTKEYQYLQLLSLLIASMFFFNGLKLYTKNYYAALLLYLGYVYLTLNMSGIRQAIALAIVFFALQYIENKSLWKYTVFVLIAASIHISALLMLPLFFIIRLEIPPKLVFIILGLGLILYFLRVSPLISFLTWFTKQDLTLIIGKYLNSYIFKFYVHLLHAKDISPKINLKVIFNVLMIAILIIRRNFLIIQNKYFNIFLNMFIIYTIIGLYLWDSGDVSIRLQHYFIVGLIILLPELISGSKRTLYKLSLLLFILVLSIWSSNPIFLERPTGVSYNPYQNYVIYKVFHIKSTGKQRRDEFMKNLQQ
jgi:hypothetical protein